MKKTILCLFSWIFLLNTTTSGAVAPTSFSDIGTYEWKNSIQILESESIVAGYKDGTYRPNAPINRAEFLKIILESAFYPESFEPFSQPCFSDVTRTDWFLKYVCFAKEEGIISGYPDGSFRPGAFISQSEALKIIFETFFEEIQLVEGEWYDRYFSEAEYMGMLYFEQKNAPHHLLTRGEMAYFIAWIVDEENPDQIDLETFDPQYAFSDISDWEPLSEEDCGEDEYFDEEDQQCYLICEGECAEGSDLNIDLEDLEYSGHHDESIDEDESVVIYVIEPDDTIKFQEARILNDVNNDEIWKDVAQHQKIWRLFSELIPASYRGKFLTEFHIFTDDVDGTLAYVNRDEKDSEKWILAVDILDAFDTNGELSEELLLTLVHEFGHILTLNSEQITPVDLLDEEDTGAFEIEKAKCFPQYFTQEGCAKSNSFLNIFFKKFWGGKIYEEWEKISDQFAQAEDEEIEIALSKFYESHIDAFVTEYAPTNVEEDIAESFAYFIWEDKPASSEILKNQKVLFFYEFPSLVKLRSVLRHNFQSIQAKESAGSF